jgi:MFS family permease
VGAKPLLVAGMTLQAVGLLLFTLVPADGTYLSDVLAPSAIVAIGIGLAFVPVTIAAVAGVASGEAGLASGLVNTSRQMGGALGLAILATVASTHTSNLLAEGHTGPREALTRGFHEAFALGAGFAVAGALTALLVLPRIRPRASAPVPAGAAPSEASGS